MGPMEKGVTRRVAVAAIAGFAGAGLVACSPGAGDGRSSGGGSGTAWDGGYLPVGSTVRLAGMPEGFNHVVVARRPLASKAGGTHDYALVQAVLGITSDLSGAGGLYAGELVLADRGDIAEVLQEGLVTEEEAWAEELLAQDPGSGASTASLLAPLIEARVKTLDGYRRSESPSSASGNEGGPEGEIGSGWTRDGS